MTTDLTADDRGKTVVSGTEQIGVIDDVRSGTAYVDPDWDNVHDDLADALDWNRNDDTYTTDSSAFTTVQNAEARLREDLF